MTLLLLALLGQSSQDMSRGERYLYKSLGDKLETISISTARMEANVAALGARVDRQRMVLDKHNNQIEQLNEFRHDFEGRMAVVVVIAATLSGVIMSWVNRRAAIFSKKRGKG